MSYFVVRLEPIVGALEQQCWATPGAGVMPSVPVVGRIGGDVHPDRVVLGSRVVTREPVDVVARSAGVLPLSDRIGEKLRTGRSYSTPPVKQLRRRRRR